MTISPLPNQQIARRSDVATTATEGTERLHLTVQQLFDHHHFQPGSLFKGLPRDCLDRIIYYLDITSALKLKETCLTFHCLIREKLRSEASQMLQFFDSASLVDMPFSQVDNYFGPLNRTLKVISIQIAKRKELERALEMAKKLNALDAYRRDDQFAYIALQQAFEGDLTAAHATLKHQSQWMRHWNSYVIIANELAQRGDDANALEMTNSISIDYLEDKLLAFKAIARAQVQRGAIKDAYETMRLAPIAQQHLVLETINYEKDLNENGTLARENPDQIPDRDDKYSIIKKIAILKSNLGDLQDSKPLNQTISDQYAQELRHAKITKGQIREGNLDAALQTVIDKIPSDYLRSVIYTSIAKVQARRLDFTNCCLTLDLITSAGPRAEAYQKCATVIFLNYLHENNRRVPEKPRS